MCLYPRFIINKRYTAYTTKKKTKHPAEYCDDFRKLYVPIGCGQCMECRRQKAQQWKVRLCEELKVQKYKYFVTLTFSNEALEELMQKANAPESNAVATIAVRRFLERYRKKYGKSLRHWFITELGHENTERIHLHGIIFPPQEMTNDELASLWKYGRTDNGRYCNIQTINYIVKYVTKIDKDHKTFQPVILCSAGLGASFCNTLAAKMTYRYIKGQSREDYTLPNGSKVALPIYMRNKMYNREERDNLWTDRLDKGEIYVEGIRIRNIQSDEGQKRYIKLLEEKQRQNEALGYGNTSEEWKKKPYNITFKMLQGAEKKL